MILFTVNSNNVFGMGVAEAGTYNVKIARASLNTSAKGNDYISMDYEVLDGKYKGGQIRYQNVTWDTSDIEASTKRFNTIVVAVGVPDGTEIPSLDKLAQALLNKTLSIDVDWGEPNSKGNIYLEVRGYHAINSEGSKPNGIERPSANLQSMIRNTSVSNSSNDPFKGGSEPIDISDDDLPF